MGTGSAVLKKYHSSKGYYSIGYTDDKTGEPHKFLIVPLIGYDGPFFYVKDLGGKYEVSGEGYIHISDWSASMESYRSGIKDTKNSLEKEGKLGYFFLDDGGVVIKKEWYRYLNGKAETKPYKTVISYNDSGR
jgi:hypothetical protein